MKDIFKLILALPFLSFQAGGSVVLGCMGFIFYSIGILIFIGSCFYMLSTITGALQGNMDSIKYLCFLVILSIITSVSVDIYWKFKKRNLPTKD
jgi:hypothetical protein